MSKLLVLVELVTLAAFRRHCLELSHLLLTRLLPILEGEPLLRLLE